MKIIKLFFDLIIISLLWFVGALPIFTVGASTNALMALCGKRIRKEEIRIVYDFIQFYKGNFYQALQCSLILVLIWYLTITYIFSRLPTLSMGFNFTAVFIILALFEVIMISLYLCGLLQKYELGIFAILKNAIIFVHAYFKESAQAFILILSAIFISITFPPISLILPGMIGIIASGFLNTSIEKYKERLKVLDDIANE